MTRKRIALAINGRFLAQPISGVQRYGRELIQALDGVPHGQKTEPADPASRRLLMIIAQKPTQSLAAPHWPLALPIRHPWKQQDVALPLVIPLGMEMVDIVAQRPPQRALAEQDHLGQTLLLDRSDPAVPAQKVENTEQV